MRSKLDSIVVDPNVMRGKPVIKGTRIAVYLIVELLASGMTEEKLLHEYPALRKEDIRAALEYASRILREEEVIPTEAQ